MVKPPMSNIIVGENMTEKTNLDIHQQHLKSRLGDVHLAASEHDSRDSPSAERMTRNDH